MKKGLFSVFIIVSCIALFGGCIKNTPYVTTINPSMTAKIGTYNFTAETTVPSTLDTQIHDTTTLLYITGNTSDPLTPRDKIVLGITKYRGITGTYSIVMSEASALYYHSGVVSAASGGVVAITRITANSIIGYFSFTTYDGLSVTNGDFNVGLP